MTNLDLKHRHIVDFFLVIKGNSLLATKMLVRSSESTHIVIGKNAKNVPKNVRGRDHSDEVEVCTIFSPAR
jgi:hypothetical protein